MQKIEAIIRPERVDAVKEALSEAGFVGLNVVGVSGRGRQKGIIYQGRAGEKRTIEMLPKAKLEIVVRDEDSERALGLILLAARTGEIGDGKVFVTPVAEAIRVRTGERGPDVL